MSSPITDGSPAAPPPKRAWSPTRIIIAIVVVLGLLVGGSVVAWNHFKSDSTPADSQSPCTGAPSNHCLGLAAGSSLPSLSEDAQRAYLERFASIKYPVLRYDIEWRGVQPKREDPLDWTAYEPLMRNIAAYNAGRPADERIRTQAVVSYAPDWAGPEELDCAAVLCGALPESAEDYGDFVAKVARKFQDLELPLQVEIWNEPNQGAFWAPQPNPTAYAALLNIAYTKVKAIDPTAVVIMGGLAHVDPSVEGDLSPPQFVEAVYQAGNGQASFDQAATHPYDGDIGETHAVYDIVATYGDGGRKIQASEVGFKSVTDLQTFLDTWFAQDWTSGFLVYAPHDLDYGPWRPDGSRDAEQFNVWWGTINHLGQRSNFS